MHVPIGGVHDSPTPIHDCVEQSEGQLAAVSPFSQLEFPHVTVLILFPSKAFNFARVAVPTKPVPLVNP